MHLDSFLTNRADDIPGAGFSPAALANILIAILQMRGAFLANSVIFDFLSVF